MVILVVAIGLEGYSFRTRGRVPAAEGNRELVAVRRRVAQLGTSVVLLEDTGALLNLVFALMGASG